MTILLWLTDLFFYIYLIVVYLQLKNQTHVLRKRSWITLAITFSFCKAYLLKSKEIYKHIRHIITHMYIGVWIRVRYISVKMSDYVTNHNPQRHISGNNFLLFSLKIMSGSNFFVFKSLFSWYKNYIYSVPCQKTLLSVCQMCYYYIDHMDLLVMWNVY